MIENSQTPEDAPMDRKIFSQKVLDFKLIENEIIKYNEELKKIENQVDPKKQ